MTSARFPNGDSEEVTLNKRAMMPMDVMEIFITLLELVEVVLFYLKIMDLVYLNDCYFFIEQNILKTWIMLHLRYKFTEDFEKDSLAFFSWSDTILFSIYSICTVYGYNQLDIFRHSPIKRLNLEFRHFCANILERYFPPQDTVS